MYNVLGSCNINDQQLSDNLKTMTIDILATLNKFCYRFSVNLNYGTSVNDDIALHFNPRRDQGEVVLNNRQNGGWGAEERHKLPNPFTELLPFEVEFVNKSNKFKVI